MKRLLAFLFLVIALALLVAIPLLRLDKYRVQIANTLSQQLGRRVVVGRLEAAFMPPALRLRDVAIMNPAGDAPLLQAEQITSPINWPALFKGRVVPQAIHLRNWTAVINRRQNGSWAWDEWLSPSAKLGQSAGWPIKTVSFDRGECRAIDSFNPGRQDFVVQILQGSWESGRKYVSVNGVFTSLPAPVSFLFQANGNFLSNSDWTGVLGLNDESRQLKLECKVASNHTTATGVAGLWRFDTVYTFLRFYGRLPITAPPASPSTLLQGWESRYEWVGSTLTFTQAATIAGGRTEAKGTVLFTAQPTASMDIGLQSAKFQPIEVALFGSAPMEGTATGLAHFELGLSSSGWSSLNGQGAFEVVDGKYFLPNASTQGLMKAKTMRYMLKKFPGFLTGGVNFSKASVRWQVRKGMFTIDNAFCHLGDIKAAATGTYDAERHGLDAYARVHITERNPTLLKELPPAYVNLGSGTPVIQPMSARIQGSVGDWKLRATRGSKIPPAVQNKLSKTIKQK